MTRGTIEETYEYHLVRIVKNVLLATKKQGTALENGEDLENFLVNHSAYFVEQVLNDIQEWMGFDDLLKQVKDE